MHLQTKCSIFNKFSQQIKAIEEAKDNYQDNQKEKVIQISWLQIWA